MTNSIWTEAPLLPRFDPLPQDAKTQVLIIGGGMAGLLCAYMLEQAGADYLLIEADEILHGVTRNTTAKITSQHGLIYHTLIRRFGVDAARLYLQANEEALGDYRRLCAEIACDFEAKDSFVYTVDRPERIDRELDALEKLDGSAEYARMLPLPVRTEGAVRFRNQAQFHPLKFAAGIAEGLHICEHTRALSIDGSTVLTDRGRIQAEKIILTTHFPLINWHGLYFLKLYQHRSYVLALEGGEALDGMYIDENETGLSFRSHQNRLLLGGGSHRTGQMGGGWTELERLAALYYPALRETHRWAAQDCMPLDGMPYIGRCSKATPNLFVATGFQKWGMTTSMAAAKILTHLVLDQPDPYAALLSPSRSMLRPQLFVNGWEACRSLLTPTKPRCPHMGCALKWNPQEHSWDCPCHGSRFDESGALMDNPAAEDLKWK